ncbi:hypothetical protein, partial [Escherichia coli]
EQILKAYYRAKPYSKQLELHSKVLGIRAFNACRPDNEYISIR